MPENYGTFINYQTKIALEPTVATHFKPGHIYISALGTLRAPLSKPYSKFRKIKIKYPLSSEDFCLRRAPSHKLLLKTHTYSFK